MRIDHNELQSSLNAVNGVTIDQKDIRKLFSLIDLTSLNDTDNAKTIKTLCEKAIIPHAHVAAVCVYPQFVEQAVTQLKGTHVKVATVANFPQGHDSFEQTTQTIHQAIHDGAHEIDVVFPYARYLGGDREVARAFLQACRKACGKHVLKIILETGELKEPALIAQMSHDAIMAGADFIKTSTGKVGLGATLEAAAVMLLTIRDTAPEVKHTVGFKASGGIRTIEQAIQYVELAQRIMGPSWVTPHTFRIGASQLVDTIRERYI